MLVNLLCMTAFEKIENIKAIERSACIFGPLFFCMKY